MTRKQAIGIVMCLLLMISGCGKKDTSKVEKEKKVVTVPVVFRANPITGEKENADLVEAFNKTYADTFHLDVKWVMETEDAYRKTLKRDNVTGNLPVILMDVRVQPSFFRRMVEDGRMMAIGDRVEASPEWKAAAGKDYPDRYAGPYKDVYLSPCGCDRLSCVGIFYHKDKLKKAGWDHFPETLKQYQKLLEDLKNSGTAALALHTEGTAWAAMLPATAELALTKEGETFVKTFLPESFDTPAGVKLAEILKRNFAYASDNAYYADFDVAYNTFLNGDAAMIANGYWMIDSIPESQRDEIGFAPFPGNRLISSPETFGWAISESATESEKKGALAFLEFRTCWERQKQEDLFETGGRNSLESAYIKAVTDNPEILPNYQINWDAVIQEKKIPEYLPLLGRGEMTPEEFVKALNQK